MGEAAIDLKVAGKTYQVVTSAAEDELKRLAKRVEDALEGVLPPGRQPSPQALVLAAITLAHELETEKARRLAAEERHKKVLQSLLGRVDQLLDDTAPAAATRGKKVLHSQSRGPEPV
jgi:cell division protein ZapA